MSSEIPPYRPLHRKASQEGRDMENIVQCYEKKPPQKRMQKISRKHIEWFSKSRRNIRK